MIGYFDPIFDLNCSYGLQGYKVYLYNAPFFMTK